MKLSLRSVRRAAKDRRDWTWGSKPPKRGELATLDLPTPHVRVIGDVRETHYFETKGGESARWEHKHDAPYPLLVTTTSKKSGPSIRKARGIPAVKPGRALFLLGELATFKGRDPAGREYSIKIPARSADLYGDPSTSRMHVVRRDKRAVPPLFLLTNGAPYRLTERGIVS